MHKPNNRRYVHDPVLLATRALGKVSFPVDRKVYYL
jgi:hypothetical protein